MRLALSSPSVSTMTARRGPAVTRQLPAGFGDRVEQAGLAARFEAASALEDVGGRGPSGWISSSASSKA